MTSKNNKVKHNAKIELLIRKGLLMLKDRKQKTEWRQKTLQQQTSGTLAPNPFWPPRNNTEKLRKSSEKCNQGENSQKLGIFQGNK